MGRSARRPGQIQVGRAGCVGILLSCATGDILSVRVLCYHCAGIDCLAIGPVCVCDISVCHVYRLCMCLLCLLAVVDSVYVD